MKKGMINHMKKRYMMYDRFCDVCYNMILTLIYDRWYTRNDIWHKICMTRDWKNDFWYDKPHDIMCTYIWCVICYMVCGLRWVIIWYMMCDRICGVLKRIWDVLFSLIHVPFQGCPKARSSTGVDPNGLPEVSRGPTLDRGRSKWPSGVGVWIRGVA